MDIKREEARDERDRRRRTPGPQTGGNRRDPRTGNRRDRRQEGNTFQHPPPNERPRNEGGTRESPPTQESDTLTSHVTPEAHRCLRRSGQWDGAKGRKNESSGVVSRMVEHSPPAGARVRAPPAKRRTSCDRLASTHGFAGCGTCSRSALGHSWIARSVRRAVLVVDDVLTHASCGISKRYTGDRWGARRVDVARCGVDSIER